ncbi:MAG: serine/threonine-protein phosphatase [Lachnospiraceae bacterium]|nr:serine/threonine-protein phosphatase [Lachnospiraceae bacterium]
MSCGEKTVDLSVERGYAVCVPKRYGIQIGKLHGIGKRENQEDAFAISEIKDDDVSQNDIFVVLADGMGGMQDGERASSAAVISCMQYYEQGDFKPDWMKDMVLNANDAAIEALGSSAGSGGSTLIAVQICEMKVKWVSVGDSHLYLYRDGELKQVNHDHNYGAVLDEQAKNGEISQEEALYHARRKALTSYIGLSDLEEIDGIGETLDMKRGDYLLLLSDGVFGTLSDDEIIANLHDSIGKSALCIQAEIESKRKANQDNYTGILIKFN